MRDPFAAARWSRATLDLTALFSFDECYRDIRGVNYLGRHRAQN